MRKVIACLVLVACLGVVGCGQPRYSTPYKQYEKPHIEKIVDYDQFDKKTTYKYYVRRHDFPEALPPDFQPIIVEKNGKKNLLVFITYTGHDWIFADKVDFKIDDREPNKVPILNTSRNVGEGYRSAIVYEGLALKIPPKVLREIADARSVIFRLSGSKGAHDMKLDYLDREGIEWILSILEERKLS